MTEIEYGKVKDSVDFVDMFDSDGCWAFHTVTFTHEGKEYIGTLQADPNLNGIIYDDEMIEDIEENK